MAKVERVEPLFIARKPKKKVAAYARVSKDTVRSLHSAAQQISYYSELIQSNNEWEYVDVYADEGITGTSAQKRPEFQRMLNDCENGKIDLILTKSVSRMARNTLELLETVRHLKALGIEIVFEEEGIHTLSSDGELLISIIASFAQAEVEATSENIKWVIRKKFERGVLNGVRPFLGYRWDASTEQLVVVPDEAELVKEIFDLCIAGNPTREIARILRREGKKTQRGSEWDHCSVKYVLGNITYTGNLLLGKTYATDPLSGRKWNYGQRGQYYSENTHEAIISMETYEKAQEKLEYFREVGNYCVLNKYPFSMMVKCGICGRSYRRGTRKTKYGMTHFWACRTQSEGSREDCDSKVIPELELYRITCELLGMEKFDEEAFHEKVNQIVVVGNDQLDYYMSDGRVIHQKWETTLYSKEGRERAKRYIYSAEGETGGQEENKPEGKA